MTLYANIALLLCVFISCQNSSHHSYSSSLDSLSFLLSNDSVNTVLLNKRAQIYLSQNQFYLAKKDIDFSYNIFKNDVNMLLTKGDIYFSLNETRVAKSSWERCLKIDPNNLACREKLTDLLCAVRHIDCKSMIDTLLLINNGMISPPLIVYLKELGEYKLAIEVLDNIVSKLPNHKEYLVLLSVLYSDTSSINQVYNSQLAEQYFENIIQLYPNYARGYYNFGKHRQNIGDYQSALSLYNQSISINPTDAQTYYNIGFCYLQIQEYTQAIEFFTKVIELDNTFLLAYHARAYLYDITKQKDKAISDWKHCLMLNPSYIPALQALSK